jgi:hypothetical protein
LWLCHEHSYYGHFAGGDLYIAMAIVGRKQVGRNLFGLFVFLFGYVATLYAAWPILWHDPVHAFIEAYRSLAYFRWDGDVWFMGQKYTGTTLPWTYLPIWFGITVAPLLLVLGLGGFIWILIDFIRSPLKGIADPVRRNSMLYALMFICPFVSIILLDSVVYDDWRHIYFVYPSFVFMAAYTMSRLNRLRLAWIAAAGIQLVFLLVFFVRYHPLHQVYFNALVPKTEENLRRNFDYDYWGASHKQAFEYILRSDTSKSIVVCRIYHAAAKDWLYPPICDNWEFLLAKDKDRIILTDSLHEAKYFLSTFRYHPWDHEEYGNNYHDIKVQNNTVIRTYKLK